jgi:hypothetical protein
MIRLLDSEKMAGRLSRIVDDLAVACQALGDLSRIQQELKGLVEELARFRRCKGCGNAFFASERGPTQLFCGARCCNQWNYEGRKEDG